MLSAEVNKDEVKNNREGAVLFYPSDMITADIRATLSQVSLFCPLCLPERSKIMLAATSGLIRCL